MKSSAVYLKAAQIVFASKDSEMFACHVLEDLGFGCGHLASYFKDDWNDGYAWLSINATFCEESLEFRTLVLCLASAISASGRGLTMESNTPRTDDASLIAHPAYPNKKGEMVRADFARLLELETVHLKQTLGFLVDVWDDHLQEPDKRSYVEGSWDIALSEARALLK